MKSRQAFMLVSRPLLEQLLPDWQTVVKLRYGDVVEMDRPVPIEDLVQPFHRALKLPNDCRITGISYQYGFQSDQVAFRIESPDFVETKECDVLPEVRAVYQGALHHTPRASAVLTAQASADDSSAYFLLWEGPAVSVQRTYGPDGNEVTSVSPCWRCHSPTLRKLPEGTAECTDCAGKALLMNLFQQKREELLARFDAAVANLRTVIQDPEWCNELYPFYQDARKNIERAVEDCLSLNVVENL